MHQFQIKLSQISVRRGVCQLRLDFLTFELPRPDNTGRCTAQVTFDVLVHRL